MLTKIRDRHMKRILWGMVLVIVPAFVLWGGWSSLRGRRHNTVGTIDNKRITINDWYKYTRLAQLYAMLNIPSTQKVTSQDMQALTIDLLVLLHKADQEKLTVSDKEVVRYIKTTLFAGRIFDEEAYENFLRRNSFSSRAFEECVRNIMRVEKLIAQNVKATVSEDEVRRLYERDTVKAKIAYLFIPYDKFKVDIGIAESALEEFYREHKDEFKREKKIKLKYTIIPHDFAQLDELTKQLPATTNLGEICNAFSLKLKETGFIGVNDPIEDVGWKPQINVIAFGLDDTAISPPVETEKGFIVMQRIETKSEFTPSLSEIKDEVRQAFILNAAKKDTESFSKELIEKINASGQPDLKTFAKKDGIEFNQTDFFGYYDYIEGLGLDERVSNTVFSLSDKQVYSKPLLLPNGAYIIQLIEKTPFDEAGFEAKKKEYTLRLRRQRELQARQKFIFTCLSETDLKIYALPEQLQ